MKRQPGATAPNSCNELWEISRRLFGAMTPPEQSEALQCVLKSVTAHPHKLDLEVLELEEFLPGSQDRMNWHREPNDAVLGIYIINARCELGLSRLDSGLPNRRCPKDSASLRAPNLTPC